MDPILSLAFLIQKNPGVYALLLGAGISHAAGILTGWEIIKDLQSQIRARSTGDIELPDNYSNLLELLGKKEAERNSFIRPYFEPTNEEREEGKKQPTQSHRAIATLVQAGFIRVIITTNFDRLLEQALQDVGVIADVAWADDMLEGMPPLQHSKATIIKLHGDFHDIRTLNTESELESYSEPKARLLNRIFSEYGLIVCGWSATWDHALRDAIVRSPQRWYSNFWIEPYQVSEKAQDLIANRKAELIQVDAENFFKNLHEQIDAIEKLNRAHPLSVSVAIERVKRLLPYAETQIELEELLINEAKRLKPFIDGLNDFGRNLDQGLSAKQAFSMVIAHTFSNMEIFFSMITTLCWYGNGEQVKTLKWIVEYCSSLEDFDFYGKHFNRIPTMLLIYIIGIPSLYREKWDYLKTVLIDPEIRERVKNDPILFLNEFNKNDVMLDLTSNNGLDVGGRLIQDAIHPLLESYLVDFYQQRDAFALFEMVLAVFLSKETKERTIEHKAISLRHSEMFKIFDSFWEKGGKKRSNWGFVNTFYDSDTHKLLTDLNTYREVLEKNETNWRDFRKPEFQKIYYKNTTE